MLKVQIDKGVKKIEDFASWLKDNIDDISEVSWSNDVDFSKVEPGKKKMIGISTKNDSDRRDKIERAVARALEKFSIKEDEPDIIFPVDEKKKVPGHLLPVISAFITFLEEHDKVASQPIMTEISSVRILSKDNKEELSNLSAKIDNMTKKVDETHALINALKELMKNS